MAHIQTSDLDDDKPVVLIWTNTEHGDNYSVSVCLGHDGVPMVNIEAPPNAGKVRVWVNDESAFFDTQKD